MQRQKKKALQKPLAVLELLLKTSSSPSGVRMIGWWPLFIPVLAAFSLIPMLRVSAQRGGALSSQEAGRIKGRAGGKHSHFRFKDRPAVWKPWYNGIAKSPMNTPKREFTSIWCEKLKLWLISDSDSDSYSQYNYMHVETSVIPGLREYIPPKNFKPCKHHNYTETAIIQSKHSE